MLIHSWPGALPGAQHDEDALRPPIYAIDGTYILAACPRCHPKATGVPLWRINGGRWSGEKNGSRLGWVCGEWAHLESEGFGSPGVDLTDGKQRAKRSPARAQSVREERRGHARRLPETQELVGRRSNNATSPTTPVRDRVKAVGPSGYAQSMPEDQDREGFKKSEYVRGWSHLPLGQSLFCVIRLLRRRPPRRREKYAIQNKSTK